MAVAKLSSDCALRPAAAPRGLLYVRWSIHLPLGRPLDVQFAPWRRAAVAAFRLDRVRLIANQMCSAAARKTGLAS